MNLNCLNGIITDNLAIHIDISDINSWDLNTGLTVNSLTKWNNTNSNNINLIDWGLTAFDIGQTNEMWNGLNLTPNDVFFSMNRIGYNTVHNPTTGETTGMTINTQYLPISAITSSVTGNYFELNGGYLNGFFKLHEYKYELLPSRYNDGITIETLLNLHSDSKGIFYLMGVRSEDKYNKYFSGETQINGDNISGVFTSEDNHLDSLEEKEVVKKAFREFENKEEIEYEEVPQSANTINNIIAFEITEDKKISYKYINDNNQIIQNTSNSSISPPTGWTIISISYQPDYLIEDPDLLYCSVRRTGKLIFFVNGRPFWILNGFPEFYFNSVKNNREKQIGVPYNINWGGGSFGLEHSWHYDKQTYNLYNENDQSYIDLNFVVESNPLPEECDPFSGGTPLSGLTLSADSTTFHKVDNCDSSIEYPTTVMRVEKLSGFTANTYFIKFDNPITVLSNRIYNVDFDLYVDGFFRQRDEENFIVNNKISTVVYGTEDVDIIDESTYKYPLTSGDLKDLPNVEKNILYDDEYSYVKDGISYYGDTGLPVYDDPGYYLFYGVSPVTGEDVLGSVITGQNQWLPMRTKFKIKDNTGKQTVSIGILVETSDEFNVDRPFYVKNFTYTGADILSQDQRKDSLLIQQNFNSSFNGGIQKLRIYDRGLSSQEILHNALIEMNENPDLNLIISRGGRIINT